MRNKILLALAMWGAGWLRGRIRRHRGRPVNSQER